MDAKALKRLEFYRYNSKATRIRELHALVDTQGGRNLITCDNSRRISFISSVHSFIGILCLRHFPFLVRVVYGHEIESIAYISYSGEWLVQTMASWGEGGVAGGAVVSAGDPCAAPLSSVVSGGALAGVSEGACGSLPLPLISGGGAVASVKVAALRNVGS